MMKRTTHPESSAPLLDPEDGRFAMNKSSTKPSVLYIQEDEEDDSVLYDKMSKRRTTSLFILDSFVLIVEILQLLAIIQSMGLRWAWPESFLVSTNFILLFNLDVWDFMKINSAGIYKHIQSYHVSSYLMPANYFYLVLGWTIVLTTFIGVFIGVYVYLRYKKHPYMLTRIARLQHVYVVLVQLIILPLGVVAGRVFHCSDSDTVDIDNSMACYTGDHWALMATAIVFLVLAFLPFPIWLICKTRNEIYIMWMSRPKHEAFLQLKELEYRQGLNLHWVLRGYHVFASFARGSVHYRAVIHLFKLSIIAVFSFVHGDIWLQAGLSLTLFSVVSLVLCLFRPYRVTACNFLITYSYLILLGLCLYGTVLASVSPTLVGSPWMLYPYNVWVLGFLTGLLVLGIIVFVVYAVLREVICYKRCCKEHLWPTLTKHGLSRLSPHTRKYMKALLQGKIFLEKINGIPPMFARADLLANHIEVVNMYCREAEYLRDVMHRPLLNLLDNMIQTHTYIRPKSLFSDTIKISLQETATNFMELLPMFTRRLNQREYDFILVSPVKKKILLKMLCMAVFLNGRAEKVAKKKMVQKAQDRLWQERPEIREFEEADCYYEDMYPAPLEEPACRPDSSLSEDENDLSDGVRGYDLFTGGTLLMSSTIPSALLQVNADPQENLPIDDEELPAYSLIDLRQDERTEEQSSRHGTPISTASQQGENNLGFVQDHPRGDNSETKADNSVHLPEQVVSFDEVDRKSKTKPGKKTNKRKK